MSFGFYATLRVLSSSFFFFITFISEIGRFLRLVYTPKKKQAFKVKYNIPTGVEIEHCHLGKWHTKRPKGAMVIPMIAFIEGGMQIPMGKVTRDF